jgi:acetyl-CoA carboxylase biotin carboxyl carrier protein
MASSKRMTSPQDAYDPDLIRELARLLEETGLTEIEIEKEGVRVRVGRDRPAAAQAAPSPASAPTAQALRAPLVAAQPATHPGVVTSPMVGIAYLAPEPGARPFVEIGSQVKVGDPLLIIEAMKTMNQIPAPRAGTVTQILIEEGRPVEFAEPLMIIE